MKFKKDLFIFPIELLTIISNRKIPQIRGFLICFYFLIIVIFNVCSTQLKAQCSSGQLKLENLTSCDYDYRIMWDTPTYCNCSAYIDNGTINAYSTLCLNYTCGYTTPEPFFIDLLMVSPTTTACNLIS